MGGSRTDELGLPPKYLCPTRFLPNTFSWTIAPRSAPPTSRIRSVDLKIFAGRTTSSSFVRSAS
jgi:hypothetical protein